MSGLRGTVHPVNNGVLIVMSYLEIKNITKSFGKFNAIKNINLQVNKGEFVCFLGPSGCGKTTLLRIICGLENADEGFIILESKDISNIEASRRNMGIVFQNYVLFPNMTIEKNIAYGLKNKKFSKNAIKLKVDEVLELVGLMSEKNKYPNELSGGQQQRVALARAIALSPNILLLDEPLSALDAKVREYLRRELKFIQKKLGITTIMVTHDQEEALTLADKIVVMKDSEIVQVGTPEEIYKNPINQYAADFIGKANFIKKDKETFMVRPEEVEYSMECKDGYESYKIKNIEFRGPFYRITADGYINSETCEIAIDMFSAIEEKYKLKKGSDIFINTLNLKKLEE